MRIRNAFFGLILLAAPVAAQSFYAFGPNPDADADIARHAPDLTAAFSLPRMSPELALDTYEHRYMRQVEDLAAYTARTLVQAELPDTRQHGEFELQRSYLAPTTLQFKAVRFSGDGFVKSNVIARMLQSEVQHVERREGPQTAITSANYKFSYKGTESIDGQFVHVYAVKPRQKRVGLFRGKIYLDVTSGSLRRAEGTLVKSPSFFIKKIDFVQDYADVDGFTFPVHVHSVAKTRIIGRAVVDIYNRDYAPAGQTVHIAMATGHN